MAIKYQATSAIILETRFQKKNGTYPVKIRITHDRVQKYYGIGISMTPEDFDKIMFDPKPRGEWKDKRLLFTSIEERARNIINEMPEFDFANFEKMFLSRHDSKNNFFDAIETARQSLIKQDRHGTAETYHSTLTALKTFHKKDILTFKEITPEFLHHFEKWMVSKGKSLTTVGIYARNIRTMFNEQIYGGNLKVESYPFGKRKYQIPTGRNVKKALELDDVEKIYRFPAEPGTMEAMAKDYWMFSYLCNGINMKDIALLKFKDIHEDKIVFHRAKTLNSTRTHSKPVVVVLMDEITEIIDRMGNKPANYDEYVFPILNHNLTTAQMHATIRQEVKNINKYIRRIAKEAGIEKDVTTYTARHTFSTVLKRSGASMELISESLGHRNMAITESYLDSFEMDIKKEFARKLVAFKKI